MPRGHKEGCQCIICQRVRAKAEREGTITQGVPQEVAIGSLAIGTKIRYKDSVYQKINALPGNSVILNPFDHSAGETVPVTLPNQTKVKPLR